MRPTLRKLEVKDIGDLERLVAENVEGIEPGLKVIDSRLLLGQAAIDLVGLDSKDSLVLIALDFTADEGLLLRVMDAYSWCLEYPDTVRRLYPTAQVSAGRPPRILFIVERLTDVFARRLKQLSFLEIDCLEFRHLEINGASAVYFDLVQHLRRTEPVTNGAPGRESASRAQERVASPRPAQVAAPLKAASVPEASPCRAPLVEPAPPAVIAPPVMIQAEPAPPVVMQPEPAPPVAIEPESAPSLASRLAELLETAAVEGAVAPAAPEPTAQSQADVVESPSAEDVARSGLQIEAAVEVARQAEPGTPMAQSEGHPEWQALLSQLGVEMPTPMSIAASEPAEPAPTVATEPAQAAAPPAPIESGAPVPAATEPVLPEAAPGTTTPAWAKPAEKPAPSTGRAYFFAQAAKNGSAAEPAAAAKPEPAKPEAVKAQPTKVEAKMPELDALNLPADGLSRQWLEFLTQLSVAK